MHGKCYGGFIMSISPTYNPPDFSSKEFVNSPLVKLEPAPADGIAPDGYHATSNHPEYIHLDLNQWVLVPESRMDSVLVVSGSSVQAVESRSLQQGDMVVVGRSENGEQGIMVHTDGFVASQTEETGKFLFRTRGTRETPFSRSYDQLYEVLRHDRDNGYIVWVLGPAVAFDKDSRNSMQGLIENGFCHALLAGNALATHDLEASIYKTGLGQDIYSQLLHPHGHYNHLDILNKVRKSGSIKSAIKDLGITDGIMYGCENNDVPYVLAGSIRDDGPLPGVYSDVYQAQDAMRLHARKATTVITMATQLHSIAFGNMTPSYRIMPDGLVRQVFFYIIDMTEFSADKLANRGSSQAVAILTNVQDFIVNLWNNLSRK